MKHARESKSRIGGLRVVQITALGISAKSFLIEHFRRLREAGAEVTLVCSDDDDARYTAELTGIRYCPLQIKPNMAPFSDIVSLCRLWRAFRRLRPHLVDAHMTKAGLMGVIGGWLTRTPIRIYHNHAMAFLSARGWRHWVFRTLEFLACRFATDVVYVSPSNMEDAIKARVCPRTKARVLGPGTICGIDTQRFNPEEAAPRGWELREEVGIPQDAWLVGVVARIVPHKGIETILQAWRRLPQAIRQRAYLCFFGRYDHPRMQALVEQAVAEPDLHVKYLGFSSEMPAWYSTMTLLAQPSRHEGWGYNVLESACCGVPAVGTRVSATIDAIHDGKTGILVPVKDPEAMARAIVRLLEDGALRECLGKAARERTLRDFDQEKICPLLVEEYYRLIRLRMSMHRPFLQDRTAAIDTSITNDRT